jgi:hypothetical protein
MILGRIDISLAYCSSTIFSENRYRLFRIMLCSSAFVGSPAGGPRGNAEA